MRVLVTICLALLLCNCAQTPPTRDADVIIVGAGIAGLSAALEASTYGARVLVIEANSVGGGHAVKAGGFALVDTALQRKKGIVDSPMLAFSDWVHRAVDPDTYWAMTYAERSSADVYDWLIAKGVEFKTIIPTPEDSVPRFHFTRGTAVNVVVPLLREALADPNIEFLWNTRVTALAKTRGRISGAATAHERLGTRRLYTAGSIILSTGGFQNNMDMVRSNWPKNRMQPKSLLMGAGHYATGDGYRLSDWAGAELKNMDRQVTFYNAISDPLDPDGRRGLVLENPRAIRVNAVGHRFMDETGDDKSLVQAVSQFEPAVHWLIFDATGAKRLRLRGTSLSRDAILNNPAITHQADTLIELANKAGISPHGLRTTVETWNRMILAGEDFKFGRFSPASPDRNAQRIATGPYYAVALRAMTRKSMGGPAINVRAQVISASGTPIAGLFAAGELTGVAGINGQYGGSGTFLGPSVFTGRVAGQWAAYYAPTATAYAPLTNLPAYGSAPAKSGLPGYWHHDNVHARVAARGYACTRCHNDQQRTESKRAVMLSRLNTCTDCH